MGRPGQNGRYGYQLEAIDAELLNVEKNMPTRGGGEIRLGVEYDKAGRVVRYHFKKKDQAGYITNGYDSGDYYTIEASEIIHGFIHEWADQSRGTPWMHASLERSKHLDKYDEAAIVNARAGANTTTVLRSEEDQEAFEGDTQGQGDYADATIQNLEPGSVTDIGTRQIVQLDPDYPHQMYDQFVKAQLRGISSGLGISYHTLSGDLEGVNYSSIRAGVMDDREVYKDIQNWFIRELICPVYEDWITHCWMNGLIRIGTRPLSRPLLDYFPADYQGRRWAWVDPQKDGMANQLAIQNRTKSRSRVIREEGGDPQSVWREIKRENEYMEELGIKPIDEIPPEPVESKDDE
jgi:lambda family phage portal protein